MIEGKVEAGDRALETARKIMARYSPHSRTWMDSQWIAELIQSAMNASDAKWQLYEREYILPQFEWAKERGIDLQQLVKDNPGKNCSRLFYEAMNAQERELREALQGILDIGKRDMSNPKYNGYFETAERLLAERGGTV